MRFLYRMGLLAGLGAVALFVFGYSLLNPSSVAAVDHDPDSLRSGERRKQLDDRANVAKKNLKKLEQVQDSSKGDQDAPQQARFGGGLPGDRLPALTCPVPTMGYWFPPDACPLLQPLCGLYVCSPDKEASMHLAVVACGDRTNETLVMLKSALVFSNTKLHCHIFAETELHFGFRQQIDSWPASIHEKLSYTIYPIMYPPGENSQEWKKLFRPCASQRLFLPELLTEVDSLLYVDTDILFLSPMENLWNFFSAMNSTQLAALAPEHEVKSIGWYNRFARHPYYGETGLNSGIMLMNLTRLRAFRFQDKIIPYYKEYKLKLTWGDQDLLNIFFHYYPERLLVFPCEWNYRPDHCMYMQNCKSAETHGVRMVHGCRRVFFNEKQPVFKAIYQALEQHQLGANTSLLVEDMKAKMAAPEVQASRCGQVSNLFLKRVETAAAAAP
ncbi:PREDICTED: glucoside xylosyltransferase 1-like isoform X2 [Branchiostoma belcheri]|uniref:UDP-D-xylose:beta-D-glucoside alpha-1,3-D-xylosyltransferase n=1 Tax=Branchiostoma belcheri TaxID=7741 RepID=A0A6P5AHR6_BRABE|nr:PREDICTED: glucoside xylosyltransferase 1-like isoform X1 [Branchiostoma belcheri]XP_019642763.1 PREDICTED: glucoside xylosyltransferase 1-like isoform X2 [Branchiostoma belcheri]